MGRSEEADITISHPKISRIHARFCVTDHQLTVEDLGSVNGTRINQRRTAHYIAVLRDGDVVSFDSVSLVVVLTGAVDDGEHTRVISGGESAVSVSSGCKLESASDLPHLIIITKSGAQQVLELEPSGGEQVDVWEIGRNQDCQIPIADDSVSTRHAQLIHQNGRWRLVNLVSTNGIYVNGKKRLMAYLADGDEIKLGMTALIFKAGSAAPIVPASASGSSITAKRTALALAAAAAAVVLWLLLT